jgi:hypothetical protein
MRAKKQRKPDVQAEPGVQVEELAAPVEELMPEQAEAAEGGFCGFHFVQKSPPPPPTSDDGLSDVIVGASADSMGH